MRSRATVALAASAVAALVAAAGVSATVTFNYSKIDFASFAGDGLGSAHSVRGVVVAGKAATGGTINVYLSLHGLPSAREGVPSTFLVAEVKRPCAKPVEDATGIVVWQTRVRTTDGAAFKQTKTRLQAPLRSGRSIRIYTTDDDFDEVACARVERQAP